MSSFEDRENRYSPCVPELDGFYFFQKHCPISAKLYWLTAVAAAHRPGPAVTIWQTTVFATSHRIDHTRMKLQAHDGHHLPIRTPKDLVNTLWHLEGSQLFSIVDLSTTQVTLAM